MLTLKKGLGAILNFFKKLGYTVYCTLEDCPDGYRKYKMLKRL